VPALQVSGFISLKKSPQSKMVGGGDGAVWEAIAFMIPRSSITLHHDKEDTIVMTEMSLYVL